MEEVNITELESRYYMDLFLCCDIEKTGKVPVLKATEMFRSAEISNDILRHIMSLAAIPQTALHLSKVQFYSCLKLIAAHQSSVALRKELIASSVTLPLPRFSWKELPSECSTTPELNGPCSSGAVSAATTTQSPDLIELARADAKHDVASSDVTSTDSEIEQKDSERKPRRDGSPEAWSTASDSPTPTNSVAERPWAQASLWPGLLCEEQRQLLGTEEESSDRHSSEEDNETDLETIYQITAEQKEYYTKQFRAVQPDPNGLLLGPIAKVFFEKSRICVEELRHIWQLCDVTKDGALNLDEFTAAMHLVVLRRNNIPLPPILPACLMPPSKRPEEPAVADLLHLNDDDKPEEIATSNSTSNADISLSYINNYTRHGSSNSPQNLAAASTTNNTSKVDGKVKSNSNTPPNDLGSPTPKSNKRSSGTKDWGNQSSKEWTKFSESPTSLLSSPGPKPLNFDMQRTAQAVCSDPQILHPVPLRITPVGAEAADDETSRVIRKSDNLIYDGGIITIRDSENSSPKYHGSHRDCGPQSDLRAIQRPQPKKIPVKNNIGAIPPPPQRESTSSVVGSNGVPDNLNTTAPILGSKKEAPPPPPRPHRHARSSSLDLNKLKLNAPVPPQVPPRVSPQMTAQISLDAQLDNVNSQFADFTHFPESVVEASENNAMKSDGDKNEAIPRAVIQSLQIKQRSSAFEVYRKPNYRESISPPDPLTTAILAKDSGPMTNDRDSLRYVSYIQEKGLADVMRHLKEQNVLLMTLCNDLSDELVTVQHKKKEIKAKIDNQAQVNNCNDDNSNQSTV